MTGSSQINKFIASYSLRGNTTEESGVAVDHMDNKLACLIKIIAEAELQSDYARLALCEAPGFDAKALFKKFDKYNKGAISIDTLKELLAKHHIVATENEILEVINVYDSNQNGRLGIYEFKDMITPKAHEVVKKPVNHGSLQDEGLLFSVVLHLEINLLRVINPLRAAIQTSRPYVPYDLFRLIDKQGHTYFDHKDLHDFMLEQNLYLHKPDILAFFRRIDKTESGRISYNEFKTVLLPELTRLQIISERDTSSINKPHDYFTYNADKYGVGPISSPTILEPAPLVADYKLGKDCIRASSAQKTHATSTRSTLRSFKQLYSSAQKSGTQSKALIQPLDDSEITGDASRYRKIYPYFTGQYAKENVSPNKAQYCPENYDSTYDAFPVRTTHDYYISEYKPYTVHPYDKTTYKPPAPVSLADRRRYVPDAFGAEKRPYYQSIKGRDPLAHPKTLNLDYEKYAGSLVPSVARTQRKVDLKQELSLASKIEDLKQYSKYYDEKDIMTATQRKVWAGKGLKRETGTFDMATTASSFGQSHQTAATASQGFASQRFGSTGVGFASNEFSKTGLFSSFQRTTLSYK